ncbi:glycoside hydrolase family 2 protein [Cucurbitaria berberidis CBS 394.84]|uniref:Glycoside hydrolase family 2 protein n=1 Tax=Cucurbitaria berberidis CBS 394.84 TaxID=1168544 RepID=A0A9P4GMT8_9PLEO|nr:glycoside hydrolase family 2 protein [Cucurbitaria berberidis CBS 394.84]KAF1848082.1 glycoside hydrolase family 2 protein [Cucurbitaria berberidis CBS 394.84]
MTSALFPNVIWFVYLALSQFTPIYSALLPRIYAPFPSWNVTSSARLSTSNATQLSHPGFDTSGWYTIGSKGTLMSTLIQNHVYNEAALFYSTNLQNVDASQFRVPWYYRSEGNLGQDNNPSYYYTLRTHGISSRADIWLNGKQVADKEIQAGAYGGLEYDVTNKLSFQGANVLLVKVYPTDYNRDFALGFVDWNPYPADNGTGIWRDIELKRTGQVSLGSLRVTTRALLDGAVDIYLEVKNVKKNASASGYIDCAIYDPNGIKLGAPRSGFDLGGGEQATFSLEARVNDPQVWWPRQWGDQPLYSVQCNATTKAGGLSDATPVTRFGIRTVTKQLDAKYNDTTFYVNGERFQVLGAGYTSDIFLRFDEDKLRAQFQYVLDMGLNTIRLEGKQEHPFLYNLADELGIMILAGWECCDKWEGWTYNVEGTGEKWTDADYNIANRSIRHEAELMQSHPSMLGFLVGSDFWPDDRATQIYVDALKAYNWNIPIIASASQNGAPDLLGNGGMRMEGPYDWVSPNYWYDNQGRLGSAAGFGSELGAGVGTPELGSLKKFLSPEDLGDLWKKESKDKGLYHMSTNVSSFYTRTIYNDALWARYGAPSSLSDYLLKAQMADYEATRSQFEAYLSRWNKALERPATGLIYWMLNNAWPSLHWNLFDYYLHPGGSYFGVKTALGKLETAVYDYGDKTVYLVNRKSRSNAPKSSDRTIDIEVIGLDGQSIVKKSVDTITDLNSSRKITSVPGLLNITDVVLLRLRLTGGRRVLSRSVYWLAPQVDVLDWDNSTWYHTPVTSYSDFTALNALPTAGVDIRAQGTRVTLENKSKIPAVFVRLNLVDGTGKDVVPVTWSENYVTLWPRERLEIEVGYGRGHNGVAIEVSGNNVKSKTVKIGGGY